MKKNVERCRWTAKPLKSCKCGDCVTNKVTSAEWVQPIRKGYLMECCDCGLIHRLNFRLVRKGNGTKIQFQAFRENEK